MVMKNFCRTINLKWLKVGALDCYEQYRYSMHGYSCSAKIIDIVKWYHLSIPRYLVFAHNRTEKPKMAFERYMKRRKRRSRTHEKTAL